MGEGEGEDRASRVLVVVWQPSSFLQAHYFDVAPCGSLFVSFVVDMSGGKFASRGRKGTFITCGFPYSVVQ